MIFVIAALLLNPLPCTAIARHKTSFKELEFSENTNIKVIHYELRLEPDLDNVYDLIGNVKIIIEPKQHVRQLKIEISRPMRIYEATANFYPRSTVKKRTLGIYEVYDKDDAMYYKFMNPLKKGSQYELEMQYSSTIHPRENMGFYLGNYREGEDYRKFVVSHLQPGHVRYVFPCFDDSQFTSTFNVTILRPSEYITLSNVELQAIRCENRFCYDVYHTPFETPAYLLALFIGQFYSIQNGNHRVFGRPEAVEKGLLNYTLEVGKLSLGYINRFFDKIYPFSKMNHLAISDRHFGSIALKNWGLTTYRESAIFLSKEKSLSAEYQDATQVIIHEMAHSYFGNLVTMKRLNYGWVNEGMCTYFEYYVASKLFPSWKMTEQFVLDVTLTSLGRGSDEIIENTTYDIEETTEHYLTYLKPAAIFAMTKNAITTDIFRIALRRYITKFKYNMTAPSDLYSRFQQVLEETDYLYLLRGIIKIATIMKSWINQEGYPLVTVIRNNDMEITVTQSRFSIHEAIRNDYSIWYIPINYVCYPRRSGFDDTTAEHWFARKQFRGFIDPQTKWIIVNKKVTGFYRVNYDETNWLRIIEHLNSENYRDIDTLNRAQLIDDSFALANFKIINYTIPLALCKYLIRERDYVPITTFLRAMGTIDKKMWAHRNYPILKKYIFDLLEGTYQYLGTREYDTDTHQDKLHRSNLLFWLCKLGHIGCIRAARRNFELWMYKGKVLPPNLLPAFFCGAMKYADEKDWLFLFLHLGQIPLEENRLRGRVIRGLACSLNSSLLERLLNETLVESTVLHKDESFTVFEAVTNSGLLGLVVAMDFIKREHELLKSRNILYPTLYRIADFVTMEWQLQVLLSIRSEVAYIDFENITEVAERNIILVKEIYWGLSDWLLEDMGMKREDIIKAIHRDNQEKVVLLLTFLIAIPMLFYLIFTVSWREYAFSFK